MGISEYIGVGGPVAIIASILGFLINSYLAKRKDDREEVRLDRESESGIVETTKSALTMVREEMKVMRESQANMRREHNEEIKELKGQVGALERENRELRKEIAELRGQR